MKPIIVILTAVLAATSHFALASGPTTFDQAKIELREKVYFDRNNSDVGELYCGCHWNWVGRSGGRVDLGSCGYEVRGQENRAQRIEWEHVLPAYAFGSQRQCWQSGGRKNCVNNDPIFRKMEADMHNLEVSVGEVNADRSNFRYGVLPSAPNQYGACLTRTDFHQRVTEPRDHVKGAVARIYFYMHDRYGLSMSRAQQQLLMAWHRQFPVSEWEQERDRRIARVMGHSNPFVTGDREWTLGMPMNGAGTIARERLQHQVSGAGASSSFSPVIGNRSSNVYHLPEGCPSYGKVGERNRIEFMSAVDAEIAGFKLAGNCR
ncbi:endonuclease [Pseudomonas paraeruginosa]|uniref:endonuclease n=1 Tax=Pseudomonas paraeruginosa TaxID=2994495 RepID=UPI00345936E3